MLPQRKNDRREATSTSLRRYGAPASDPAGSRSMRSRKSGVDEHPLQRELDARREVAAAVALPAALEEREQRVDVVGRHRPAVGESREPRDDLGGAGAFVGGHRGFRSRCCPGTRHGSGSRLRRRGRRLRPAGEDGAAARSVAGAGHRVRTADGDRADGGVAVVRLVVRQHLARLPRLEDALRLPHVAHERHPDGARPRLDRHADLETLVRRLQVRLPLRVAPLGDGERHRSRPAAVLAADGEAPHELAIDTHVEQMGAAHPEDCSPASWRATRS